MRLLSTLILAFSIPCAICNAQVRDTARREIGINVSWRSILLIPEVKTAQDAIGYLQLGVEVRAWRFWIQTGVSITMERRWSTTMPESTTLLLHVSAPYEIALFKRRVFLGAGPILSYLHTFSQPPRSENGYIGIGLDIELTVPIWKGLSLETCSDMGFAWPTHYAVQNVESNSKMNLQFVRILSFGVNYRFNAW